MSKVSVQAKTSGYNPSSKIQTVEQLDALQRYMRKYIGHMDQTGPPTTPIWPTNTPGKTASEKIKEHIKITQKKYDTRPKTVGSPNPYRKIKWSKYQGHFENELSPMRSNDDSLAKKRSILRNTNIPKVHQYDQTKDKKIYLLSELS